MSAHYGGRWRPWRPHQVTTRLEIVDDERDSMTIRAWITSWDRLFSPVRRGGVGVALTGMAALTAIGMLSLPPLSTAALISLGVVAFGGTSHLVGRGLRALLRRAAEKGQAMGQPRDLCWTSSGEESFRTSQSSSLRVEDRLFDCREILQLTLVDRPPKTEHIWHLIITTVDDTFEPFPPFLGPEAAVRPVVEKLALRCDASLSVAR